MKKSLLVATLVAASATSALAQDNVLKVNIISPIVKTGSFFYERKLTDNSSLQLGLLFTNFKVSDEDQIMGFAITPEYRFYLSEKTTALQGFYVGPFLRYQNLTVKTSYTDYDTNGNPSRATDETALNTFGGGMVVGRHWIFKERFSLDTFLGPSYNAGSVSNKSTSSGTVTFDPGPFDGFGVRAGITFGIAF
jgi:opacity protein-like surface antigen